MPDALPLDLRPPAFLSPVAFGARLLAVRIANLGHESVCIDTLHEEALNPGQTTIGE